MKRLTFVVPAMLLAAYLVHAQNPPPGGPPPRGGPPFERIAKDLDLDENQKPEVQRILEELRVKREAEMKAKMEQDDAALLTALQGVLRTDQLAKLQQIQADRRAHMRMGPPGRPPSDEK